jgi:protein-disulfide isomerase
MRRGAMAVVALAAAIPCAAQQVGEPAIRAFSISFLSYMPGSSIAVKESTNGTTTAGPYQAVRVERSSIKPDAKDELGLLIDPSARTVAAGLLFPLPVTNPPVTAETLPFFVQQVLPQALTQWLSSRVKIQWSTSPVKPGAVVALAAEVSTGYGWMRMPIAVSADGKNLVIGDTWPLDRDPRAVRRDILDASAVQWDPGHENAAVKIVEFSDFQCPACKRGWGEVKPVLAQLGERVRHGLVSYPLVAMHPWAFRAAVAGECIGQFWPDQLLPLKEEFYRLQDTMTVDSVDKVAGSFLAAHGLDGKKFDACYFKDPSVDAVLRNLELGYRLGVFGTPSYFANGEAQPWSEPEWLGKRIQSIAAAGGRPESAAEIVAKAPTRIPTPAPTASAGVPK